MNEETDKVETGDVDSISFYLRSIGHYQLVSIEEEAILSSKIQNGDMEARAILIKANLRLVIKIAHDFKGLGLPFKDLVSEGNIGLMIAVERFDSSKGAKFSYYAAWWIKQKMRRALSNQARTIRLPVGQVSKISKICQVNAELEKKLGREPTKDEISEETDFQTGDITSILLAGRPTLSLDGSVSPNDDSDDRNLFDTIPDNVTPDPSQEVSDMDTFRLLREQIEKLDPIKRNVIKLRFGLLPDMERPPTLHEVSKIIGNCFANVHRIEGQALTELRNALRSSI